MCVCVCVPFSAFLIHLKDHTLSKCNKKAHSCNVMNNYYESLNFRLKDFISSPQVFWTSPKTGHLDSVSINIHLGLLHKLCDLITLSIFSKWKTEGSGEGRKAGQMTYKRNDYTQVMKACDSIAN